MTQAEYREEINKYKEFLKESNKQLEEERLKNYNYQQVLEDYHRINEYLRREQEINTQIKMENQQLRETIEQYEKILNRVNISC
jgi:hypothetical protein